MGSTFNDDATGVAVDPSGDVYVAVEVSGEIHGQVFAGGTDSGIVKYSKSGTHLWTRLFGGTGGDRTGGIDAYGSSYIYLAGKTDRSLDGNTHAGSDDLFVAKYSVDGERLWIRQIGDVGLDWGFDVAADSAGNAYVVGSTDGEVGGATSVGGTDILVVKYDAAGNLQWTQQFGSPARDIAYAVEVEPDGDIVVGGLTEGSVGGATNAGGVDLLVIKINSGGAVLWTFQMGTAEAEEVHAVATDADGNILVAGSTVGNLDGNIGVGGDDFFLVKLRSDSTKLWTRQYGTSAGDNATAVAVDASGFAYVAGDTGGGLGGNPSAGFRDVFLVKYDTSGNPAWTRQFGTASGDYANGNAVDADGGVYIVGSSPGALDGNTPAGAADAFTAKYDASGSRR